ncbi:MAG: hypothetical protein DMG69_25445 [Acidobacteria bacterium]|nr:MAG: hypothetical protein DMG69_25445 [Acidobacteriota bacterium]
MEVRGVAGKSPEFALICPACLHKNEVQQRFCGLCGFPLKPRQADAKAAPQAAQELPFVDRSENAWQWLRERHLEELASRQKRISRWITLAIVLLLLALGSGAWLFWKNWSQFGAGWLSDSLTVSAPNRETLPILVEEPGNGKPDAATGNLGETGSETVAESTVAHRSGNALEEGAHEFLEGRRYLEGQGVAKNSALAAAWLWKSVARKNVNAVLLLSDLYARGDGVPQSCDQARLLLGAAARKGSAKAKDKLLALPRMGCR